MANGSIADYLVPVNADVRELDVIFVEEHDPHVNPLGFSLLPGSARSIFSVDSAAVTGA